MLDLNDKLILVFVYKPHETIFEQFRQNVGWGLQYLPIENVLPLDTYLTEVYDALRNIYHNIARKYNLPVIDLSKTFDPSNQSHYGTTPIEPSNLSGSTIARLIKHVIENHDFEDAAVSYYAPNCGQSIRCQSIRN